ncbi:hypothetical protein D9619_000533 [Psilocybe cf. subviscida]|uniref:Mitochondrial distribution and morphology protein 34 n=1 Tax=Psilocybe cf. subviscida TaxID=2480587 RepID=A0A8H5BCU5_9AGAR|nr:hypothetical protein D9619_000533 [Psilocybe cf. subviscida]
MSFTFNWPRFSDQFHYDAIQMLNTALNKGNKPPIIADKIEVVELEMGTQPPELEIRDIGDLTVDQFRGIFRMTYSGDAHLVLKTKVQANPLNHKQPNIHLMGGSRGMLAAKQPLVVPMLLRLSHFRLSSYVVLVVSKQKGITLVFKTDPLQSVDISSTFDSIAVIQNFIQREIEGQLRQMFREDLPGIIHRLSQQWVKAKVEAPYLNKAPSMPDRGISTMSTPDFTGSAASRSFGAMSAPDTFRTRSPHISRRASQTSLGSPRKGAMPGSGGSVAGSSRSHSRFAPPTPSPLSPEPPTSSHPDLENFDPTYGLRPEGLPTKSVFRGFSSLFTPPKGLADLAEEAEATNSEASDEEYEDEVGSFDFVDWNHSESPMSLPASRQSPAPSSHEGTPEPEYETIPAVGGGTITRPRIYHSQSSAQGTSKSLGALPMRSYSQSMMSMGIGLGVPGHSSPRLGTSTPYYPEYGSSIPGPSNSISHGQRPSTLGRPRSPDSFDSEPSRSSSGPSTRRTVSTDLTDHTNPYADQTSSTGTTSPIYMRRRMSVASNATTTSTAYPHAHHQQQYWPQHTHPGRARSPSAASTSFLSTSPSSPSSHSHMHIHLDRDPASIVLRPSLNNDSIHQLSTLSHSNHTLSPYTRGLAHFTVRSVPPRPRGGAAGPGGSGASSQQSLPEMQKPRARRKRTYRIGGKKANTAPPASVDENAAMLEGTTPIDRMSSSSPTPPSEFDAADMDRYFPPRGMPGGMRSAGMGYDDHDDEANMKTVRPKAFNVRPMASATNSSQYSSTGLHQRPSARSLF